MNVLIVGSVAMNQYRDPVKTNDTDMIADYDSAVKILKMQECTQIYPINGGKTLFGRAASGIYEVEIAWPDSSGATLLEGVQGIQYATLNQLYMLKMSHRFLKNSPHFQKTRRDILEMRELGAEIDDPAWFKTREKETYWYELPNLDREKEDFFVDLYQYDHDSLHEAVAVLPGCPAYTLYQKPDAKGVQCSKEMFFDGAESTRLCGVVEEAMVLSLERSLIPFPGVKTEREAFLFALEKVCTSITSGWFRDYAYENYDECVDLYDALPHKQLELLSCGLEAGIVKENPAWTTKS